MIEHEFAVGRSAGGPVGPATNLGVVQRVRALLARRYKLVIAIAIAAIAAAALLWGLIPSGERKTFRLAATLPPAGLEGALFQSLGVNFEPGHELSLLDNGQVFDEIEDQASRARSSMHVLIYIWEPGRASDRVTGALMAAVKAGAACRVLVDDLGSPDFMKKVGTGLSAGGCEVRVMRPGKREVLARNHRKLLIFDGKVAITGGFGIRDNWLGNGKSEEAWRDANVRFSGPAVKDAQQAFAENWQEAGGSWLPAEVFSIPAATAGARAAFVSSTGSSTITRAERLVQLTIAAAQRRLWIANAYFVPSKGILELLKEKAARGVDVRILAPGKKSDSKASFGGQHMEYGSLLDAHIRIWEYQPSMMHAKTILVDEALALVSSINLEPLSLGELDEVGLLAEDSTLAARLEQTFRADCQLATELKPD